MDASKPLLPSEDIEEEYEQLDKLYKECEAFLVRWKAYKPFKSEVPADAVVAVFELQRDVVARKSYILGALQQRELPF